MNVKRAALMLTIALLAIACVKRPPVYDQQIANCADEIGKTEQLRSVSGHDDDADLQRKKDAVALSEYFLNHCFPNPYDPPAADEPVSGTVGEIIEYQRRVHNQKYPYDEI